jgi:signal transduction histidine kinase
MRFTVTTKIVVSICTIFFVGLLAMTLIHQGLSIVMANLHKLASIEEPLNASTYEMEINVNGMGLEVLKYLATGQEYYRSQVIRDNDDFNGFHRRYMALAKTENERQLGEKILGLYTEFWGLAEGLMHRRDERERLFETVILRLEEIDRMLDAHQQQVATRGRRDRDRFTKVLTLSSMEAEVAEVGFWAANYQRRHDPEDKELLFTKLGNVKGQLAKYATLRQTADDRQAIDETVRGAVAEVENKIGAVLRLDDEIREARQRFIDLRVLIDELLDKEMQVLARANLEAPRLHAEQAVEHVLALMQYLVPLYAIAASIATVLLIRLLLKPIRQLMIGLKSVAGGNLEHRVHVTHNDEFADLAQGFNQMVQQLEATTVSRDQLERREDELRQTVGQLQQEISERERVQKERLRLETALRRSETLSAMGTLVAGVAHQVRNPLFGMSSIVDAIEARFGEQQDYHRYLGVLRGEITRVNTLMRELLDYGKPAALEETDVSIEAVVSDAITACTPLATQSCVGVVSTLEPQLSPILSDRQRLAQVFQNLIENAIQHSPVDARVEVQVCECKRDGEAWIECTIMDCGPGFSPEDLPRLFEPFFTRRGGGSGLGLSIAQRIVEQHGGTLTAANRAEGGAVMTVRLPVDRSSPHRCTPEVETRA